MYNVEIDRDVGIPLPDGVRLSAKIWRPAGCDQPLPAIVEYLPYRKSDGTAARDALMHPYFAAHGYVSIRVDRRGCGDSQGLFDDEYSEQELGDGVDIVNWIAAQPWCDGNIGMQGISWGGFNSLQIAARRPAPLKAIITIGSTVDRYADDIHYKGGIQVGENIGWAATSMSWFSMPPDPALVGEAWRDMWMARLNNTPFLAATWMSHPDRDGYWQHGSVCEDYSAIAIPVLAMGGLHDGYRNTMAHLCENLKSPVQGIAGPWSHKYPHISTVGPSIDYLGEALKWWDRWLKGKENGVDANPTYRAYVMDSTPPNPGLGHRSGRWIAEDTWPSAAIETRVYPFGPGTLGQEQPFSIELRSDMAVGKNCGEYFPFGFGPGELPDDQTEDDARSACFDSELTGADMDVVGAPVVRLRLRSDRAAAQAIVRLCDIRPDGTSALVSFGFLNLQHRNGFDRATPLEPGCTYDVSIPLDQTAYRLPAGHRLRVAVSGSYWPYCWPEGAHTCLTLVSGALDLPCRNPAEADEVSFDAPPAMEAPVPDILDPSRESKSYRVENGLITLELVGDHGRQRDPETGLVTASEMREVWTIRENDPSSARVEIQWTRSLGRDNWSVSTTVLTEMWASEDRFYFRQVLRAFEGDSQVFDKTFEDSVPRRALISDG